MSLLLEIKSMPALIIKPRLILVTLSDELIWYITSDQQGKMFVQNLTRIVSKPKATPGQILYCPADCNPVDLMFRENFPTNTQVCNRLSNRNDCRQRGVIRVTERCQGYQSSGGQLFHHKHGLGREPTDRNLRLLRSQRPQLHDGS